MLDIIREKTLSLFSSSKFYVILFLIALFIAIAAYVYFKYVTPMINKNYVANQEFLNEQDDSADGGTVDVYIFTVEWCPHSKKAIPIWNDLKQEYKDKKINGKKLLFHEIDGEKDPELADKYKIEGYPTIKLVKDNQVIEYDAKPEINTLNEFLNGSI